MGFYGDQVVPRLMNVACGAARNDRLRRRVCAGLAGDVLEIGFGSGLNIPFYPPSVRRVAAVEPADVGWRLAGGRLAATTIPIRRTGLDGQALPLPDNSHDTALSTWTMCTIPDAHAALLEVRRVLKPGSTLHFVEAWPPTRTCSAGNAGSSRGRSGSLADATSPDRSPSC